MRKFVKAVERVNKLEAQLLRTEQRIDEKEETIYHNRHESRNKIRHLKLAVQVRPFVLVCSLDARPHIHESYST